MKIYLIGTGMGGGGTLTAAAAAACDEAEVLIGAPRMLKDINKASKPVFGSYITEDVCRFIESHTEYTSAAILVSGDISFYSAAKKLRSALKGHEIIPVPGISSLSYMCAKLGMPYEDVETVSLHGRENSFVCRVRDNQFTFMLLSGSADVKKAAEKLCLFGMEGCVIHVGTRLGYADERIVSFEAESCAEELKAPLCVIIENPAAKNILGTHIPDSEFIRSKTPMTKSSVRAVSIARLQLQKESVVYDVGAGTGSVSIEASLRSHDIKVYAIERNKEALELIKLNAMKFGADNIEVIEGEAPQALEQLPAPTHVFIGGSGGKAEAVIGAVLKKNPSARIVMNTVTIESAAAAAASAKRFGLDISAICINAAEAKKAGACMLMTAQNPVYIFTLEGHDESK